MNTSELYDLTRWIEQHIVNASIPQHYRGLYQVLQQHVQASQPKQSFAVQRDQLISALWAVPLDSLSQQQLHFLGDVGILPAVGLQGVENVEDTLYRNVIDVATSAETIGQMLYSLQQGIDRSSQIGNGLRGIFDSGVDGIDGDVIMRIVFSGKAAIANLADFKYWGDLWHDIGFGIAYAHGETVEQVRIPDAGSGSVSLELAVSLHFASTASDIILGALRLAEKVQDINRKAEELRGLRLKNNKLIMDLEREAELETRSGVENVSADIVKKLGLRKNGEGDKITALMKSVKHLMYFINNGGDVDFLLQHARHGDDEHAAFDELYDSFRDIRELRNRMRANTEQSTVIQAA